MAVILTWAEFDPFVAMIRLSFNGKGCDGAVVVCAWDPAQVGSQVLNLHRETGRGSRGSYKEENQQVSWSNVMNNS